MNLSERDLDRALAPLAGDPSQDFAAVMARIETESLPAPAPRGPWWLITAAAAACILGGFGLGYLTNADALPPQQVPVPLPVAADSPRVVFAGGELALETDAGVTALMPGSSFPFDHFVTSNDKSNALIALPGATELRITGPQRLSVSTPRSATFLAGRIFIRVPESAGRFHLETIEGSIECAQGAFQVETRDETTYIIAVDGEIRFTSLAAEERTLRRGEACSIDAGAVGASQSLKSLWTTVRWQHDLLMQVGRSEELLDFLYPLVWQLDEPALAKEAGYQLRQAGTLGALAIGYLLQEELDERRGPLWRRAVTLYCEIADSVSFRLAEPLLMVEDGEVRVLAAQMIERVTGIASGRDLEFWREASQSDRYDVVRAWRGKLDEF